MSLVVMLSLTGLLPLAEGNCHYSGRFQDSRLVWGCARRVEPFSSSVPGTCPESPNLAAEFDRRSSNSKPPRLGASTPPPVGSSPTATCLRVLLGRRCVGRVFASDRTRHIAFDCRFRLNLRSSAERYLDILQEWAIISWNDIFPALLCDLQRTGGQSVATNAIPSALQG